MSEGEGIIVNKMPISCQEALDLSFIIDQTAQIEDLLDVKGMEQELRDLAVLPIPSYIPPLAEVVDAFNKNLAVIPDVLSASRSREIYDTCEQLREETSKFLLSAMARCLVSQVKEK